MVNKLSYNFINTKKSFLAVIKLRKKIMLTFVVLFAKYPNLIESAYLSVSFHCFDFMLRK